MPGTSTSPRAYAAVPRTIRSCPSDGWGKDSSYIELLVRAKVTEPGTWHYSGYEVIYRSGFVRHRMVVEADFWVCTPSGATRPPGTDD